MPLLPQTFSAKTASCFSGLKCPEARMLFTPCRMLEKRVSFCYSEFGCLQFKSGKEGFPLT